MSISSLSRKAARKAFRAGSKEQEFFSYRVMGKASYNPQTQTTQPKVLSTHSFKAFKTAVKLEERSGTGLETHRLTALLSKLPNGISIHDTVQDSNSISWEVLDFKRDLTGTLGILMVRLAR